MVKIYGGDSVDSLTTPIYTTSSSGYNGTVDISGYAYIKISMEQDGGAASSVVTFDAE